MPDDGRVTSITSNQTPYELDGLYASLGEFYGLRVNLVLEDEFHERVIRHEIRF